MDDLNRTAVELVDEAIDFADELNVGVRPLDNDATVLDFGVNADGGLEAGLLLAEIQTGGLATVQSRLADLDGTPRTAIELATDHAALALLGAQQADWRISTAGFTARGGGPARLLAGADATPGTGHAEDADFAVLALEATDLPDEAVAARVAERTGVPTSGVFLPTAPVASLAGRVAVAAKAAEVAVFRLERLGYDPTDVRSAVGSAPVAPSGADETSALGLVNDALAYGARVHLTVRSGFDRFADLPFAATPRAGGSFTDAFEAAPADLEAIEDAVAPAQATVDVLGGPTETHGAVDDARLAERFAR